MSESEQEPQSEKPPERLEFKAGFTIALGVDGRLIFKLHGQDPGLVELLGLAELARKNIDELVYAHFDRKNAS
jgi:hypothetical protein